MHFDPNTFASAAADITKLGEQNMLIVWQAVIAVFYLILISQIMKTLIAEMLTRKKCCCVSLIVRHHLKTDRQERHPQTTVNETDITSAVADEFLEFPTRHPTPLKILETELPLFWRSKRTVAIEEGDLTDELKAALEAKGVNYFVLPSHPEDRKRTLGELKKALET